MSRYWQLVQCILESQRKADDQQQRTNRNFTRRGQVINSKRGTNQFGRQCCSLQADHGNIDIAGEIIALSPYAPSVAVQRNLEIHELRNVIPIRVQCDSHKIRKVLARFIADNVPARYQEELPASFKKEPAGIRQGLIAIERQHLDARQQQRVNHGFYDDTQLSMRLRYGLLQSQPFPL